MINKYQTHRCEPHLHSYFAPDVLQKDEHNVLIWALVRPYFKYC